MCVAPPASSAVETVRPEKLVASSLASSSAPSSNGEAQSTTDLEKEIGWPWTSPGMKSGREVRFR